MGKCLLSPLKAIESTFINSLPLKAFLTLSFLSWTNMARLALLIPKLQPYYTKLSEASFWQEIIL